MGPVGPSVRASADGQPDPLSIVPRAFRKPPDPGGFLTSGRSLLLARCKMEEATYETRIAHLVRTRPDLVEIRMKHGSTMDMAGVREVYEQRQRIFGDQPHASLVIIPDDADIELAITKVDHYSTTRT